jgi:hypothetical protein
MKNSASNLSILTRLSLECPSYSDQQLAELFQDKIFSLKSHSQVLSYIKKLRSSIKFKKLLQLSEKGWQLDFFDQFQKNHQHLNFSPSNLSSVGDQDLIALYQQNGWTNLHSSKITDNISSQRKKITLITSMFRCADWLKICLDNITSQTAFGDCEVLLFDCERNHELFLACYPYLVQHENIRYLRLIRDPGLYGVWNIGVQLSEGKYLGNMNTDDLRSPYQLQSLMQVLETNHNVSIASTAIVPYQQQDIDHVTTLGLSLADSTSLWPSQDEAWFTYLHGCYGIKHLFKINEAGLATESQCIPHCAPLWKKSLHEKFGFFNESFYSSAADWGFWCTALEHNNQAYLVGKPYTYYYVNPNSYMRRDELADEINDRLCAAFNDESLSIETGKGLLFDCGLIPTENIDFVINLP